MNQIEFTDTKNDLELISNQEIPIVENKGPQDLMGSKFGPVIVKAGKQVIRYGLVLVIAWIGAMKFTGYEANGIQPLVANSPLTSWLYSIFSVSTLAAILGMIEILIAAMIAMYPISKKIAAVGSLLAVFLFVTTLSFLLSTPGWEPSLGGFPALSIVPGQFLIKDVVLLGAAIWSLGEALNRS